MTIGDLVVNLGLNNKPFTTGLASARGMLSTFNTGLMKMAGLAGGVGAAVTGMFAVGSLGSWTTTAFSAIDASSKLANSLGISINELEGLSHAGNLSGVSMETLTTALRKMQINAPGQEFMTIAKHLTEITDPAERAAEAVKIFGKSGQQLLPMFSAGLRPLQEMIAEGTRLSGVDPIDASKIEAANDAITRMQTAFMGIGRTLAIQLAPWFETFANGIRSLLPSTDTLNQGVSLFMTVMRQVVPVIGAVTTAMFAITAVQKSIAVGQALILALSGPAGWGTLAAAAAIAGVAYVGINSALDGVAQRAKAAQQDAAGLNGTMQGITPPGGIAEFSNGLSQAQQKMAGLRDEIALLKAPEGMKELVKERQELAKLSAEGASGVELTQLHNLMAERRKLLKLQEQQSKEQEHLNSLQQDMQGRLASLRTPFEQMTADVAKFREAFDKGLINSGELQKLSKNAAAESIQKQNGNDKAGLNDGKGPEALRVGTSGALASIAKAGFAQDDAKRTRDHQKRLEQLAKQQLASLNNIASAVQDQPATEEADF